MSGNGEKRDFDKEAAAWDENPGRVKLAHDVATTIRDEVPLNPRMDVLDFGCGTGLLTLGLQPFVRSITGVDSSQGMLEVLRAKVESRKLPNVHARHMDLDEGDVLDGRYDLIVSSMTFHHIREVGPLLSQFQKVCAPSGHICIADIDPGAGRFHTDNYGVFHFGFDRTALHQAGFEDVRDRTAATMTKPISGGTVRAFTVFLLTGRKKP